MPSRRAQPLAPQADADESDCKGSLSTGDLARACSTTVRTVRFYEEAGLICPDARSGGGHRQFDDTGLMKLQLIMDLREAGISLNEIKALFQLKRKAEGPEDAAAKMSEALGTQIDEMQRKIAVLRRLREELAAMVSVLEECRACDLEGFPKPCGNCDVMTRQDLPRAMRLLWDDC